MSASITFFPNKDTMKSEAFFVNGTFTVPKGIHHLLVHGAGGGGGGQSGSSSDAWAIGGLGGGGVIPHAIWINVEPGDIINYTIGAGGAGGSASNGSARVGANGGSTLVTLANGNTMTFPGGFGGGRAGVLGSTSGAYISRIPGGIRVNNSDGKNVSTTNGDSSHYAVGGSHGGRITATDQPYDVGGAGGGAGYEAGGNGGRPGDTSQTSGAGENGGITAGGGGGGANGNGPQGGSGPFPSGAGGTGGPGMVIFQWSEHK